MIESNIHQANDKLFKLALEEIAVAKEFFNAHLPKGIREKIDLETLHFENHSFIDRAYKKTEADVLYSVALNNHTGYLYTLVEQQSSVDHFIAFRLLVYMVRIIERHLKQHPQDHHLPLVFPMVIYTGDDPWHAPLDIFPLFGELEALAREFFLKPCQFMDVNRISDQELREQMLSGLVAFTLKHRKMANFRAFLQDLLPWAHQVEILGEHGTSLASLVLRYVVNRVPQGKKDLLIEGAQQYLSANLRGEIMTIAEQWKEEGKQEIMTMAEEWKQESREEGRQQGMQQGIQQGEAALLMRQIVHRFGNISPATAQKIMQADPELLLVWSQKILDATQLEEIFADTFEE